jgi:hypothetical protein
MSRKGGATMIENLNKKISRRTLLKGVVGMTGVALATVYTVTAQGKAFKAAMKYQDKPKGDQECSNCKFFISGKTSTANGTCRVVEGSISPTGWCTAYVKK